MRWMRADVHAQRRAGEARTGSHSRIVQGPISAAQGMGIMSQFPSLWRCTVDFNKLIARVKNILLTPKTEWPVIAGETETVQSLYLNYILILAAIPAVFSFIKMTVIGISIPFIGTTRVGFFHGLTHMILSYVASLAVIFVIGFIIDLLAPSFGGQKNQMQALKTAAYAHTAAWVAGVFALLGVL